MKIGWICSHLNWRNENSTSPPTFRWVQANCGDLPSTCLMRKWIAEDMCCIASNKNKTPLIPSSTPIHRTSNCIILTSGMRVRKRKSHRAKFGKSSMLSLNRGKQAERKQTSSSGWATRTTGSWRLWALDVRQNRPWGGTSRRIFGVVHHIQHQTIGLCWPVQEIMAPVPKLLHQGRKTTMPTRGGRPAQASIGSKLCAACLFTHQDQAMILQDIDVHNDLFAMFTSHDVPPIWCCPPCWEGQGWLEALLESPKLHAVIAEHRHDWWTLVDLVVQKALKPWHYACIVRLHFSEDHALETLLLGEDVWGELNEFAGLYDVEEELRQLVETGQNDKASYSAPLVEHWWKRWNHCWLYRGQSLNNAEKVGGERREGTPSNVKQQFIHPHAKMGQDNASLFSGITTWMMTVVKEILSRDWCQNRRIQGSYFTKYDVLENIGFQKAVINSTFLNPPIASGICSGRLVYCSRGDRT